MVANKKTLNCSSLTDEAIQLAPNLEFPSINQRQLPKTSYILVCALFCTTTQFYWNKISSGQTMQLVQNPNFLSPHQWRVSWGGTFSPKIELANPAQLSEAANPRYFIMLCGISCESAGISLSRLSLAKKAKLNFFETLASAVLARCPNTASPEAEFMNV